jgi:cyclic dehypoxanthinyl futalosine synthase
MTAAEILVAASNGERISPDGALALFEQAALPELAWAADRICSLKHPARLRTYVIDRNINYTNICVSGCAFCAFYRPPGHPEAYVLSDEQIMDKIREAVDLGATQILMQGGLHPDLEIDYFEALLRKIKSRFHVQIHSLSGPEIVHIARISGLPIEETLRRLHAAGLDSLPGGGAEILVDEVRRRVSPHKCTADEWLDVMRAAAGMGMRATATMVFGMGESLRDRCGHLSRIRDLQDETGVFTAFIPWTFQPGNTELAGQASFGAKSLPKHSSPGPVGAHDYLRTLAISRLFLDSIDNIQASWVTQGADIAELALRFGANDIGSTMIEENVVAAAGISHSMTEADLIAVIHRAGFDAAQRDTMYSIVKEYPANYNTEARNCPAN